MYFTIYLQYVTICKIHSSRHLDKTAQRNSQHCIKLHSELHNELHNMVHTKIEKNIFFAFWLC